MKQESSRHRLFAVVTSLLALSACSGVLDIGSFHDAQQTGPEDRDALGEGGGGGGGDGGGGGGTDDPRHGDLLWYEVFAGSEADIGSALSIDSVGTATLAGTVDGPTLFGDTSVGANGERRMWVSRLADEGDVLNVTSSTGTALVEVTGLASSVGSIALIGTMHDGDMLFGGQSAATASNDTDGFLALLNADDLSVDALVTFSDMSALPQEQVVTAVAFTDDGGTVVGGSFRGEITLGGQTLQSTAQRDGFVAKISASGALVWLTPVGANGNDDVTALAVRDDGSIYVGGSYDGEGPGITGLPPKTGQVDAFLVVLDANGAATGRENHFGDSGGRAFVRALHVTDAGVTMAGEFTRSIIFEQRHVSGVNGDEPDDPQPTADAFVVRLDDALQPSWSRRFGAHGDDAATSVVVDGNDDVVISGYFESSVPFIPGTSMDSNGDADGFVGKLDGASGEPLWVHAIGRNEPDAVTGMVVDQQNRVVVLGTFESGFTLEGESVVGRAAQDVCVIAFSP